jgi:hypothetical protein
MKEESLMSSKAAVTAVLFAGLMAGAAVGDITVTQGPDAPTYGITLNFDEPGGPTGLVPPDSWSGDPWRITEFQAGDGFPVVDDFTDLFPWVGTGNSFFGNFGAFIKFENDLTEFSVAVWDPSGPPSPFGGGLGVFVFNDDELLTQGIGEPAWGGLGDPWWNVTTSDGMVFDEVRILGFGFFPTTYVDDLSWNVVPEPSSLLLALGAFALMFRRRK